jgi:AcrR family transcriptional regulator
VTREEVRRLTDAGLSKSQIARELGVNRSTVTYHLRRLHLPVAEEFGKRYDWEEIAAAYEAGLSARQCREKFGCSRDAWNEAVRRGVVVLRPRRIPLEELLVRGRNTSRTYLKARLIDAGLKENKCEECGITHWRGRPLSMHLHHKNGDPLDNRLENLQLLCPNDHSLTENYGGRNGHRRPLPSDQRSAVP